MGWTAPRQHDPPHRRPSSPITPSSPDRPGAGPDRRGVRPVTAMPRSAEGEGVAGTAGELDPDRLFLEVLVDGVDAILPAEPGVLEPAEGHRGRDNPVGVDPHAARL